MTHASVYGVSLLCFFAREQRTDKALLEISKFGIRILDRADNQVIKAIAMSLIHSWSPEPRSIVFVCTNGSMELYSIDLGTTQCNEILSCLQNIVSEVLRTRKERALNETEVCSLLSSLNRHVEQSPSWRC